MLFALDSTIASVSRFLLLPFDPRHLFITQVANNEVDADLFILGVAAPPVPATLATIFALTVQFGN